MARPPADHRKLDRATILSAAARLVNAEGGRALSINRLARELDVRPPSLYNHVDGLAGIQRELALLNAHTIGERFAEAAIGKAGAEAIEAVSRAYRSYILENPGLYLSTISASRSSAEPDAELASAEDRVVRVVVTVLEPYRLEEAEAIHVVRALRSLVHGFASLEAAGGFGLSLDIEESFTVLIRTFIRGIEHRSFSPLKEKR